MGVKTRGMWLFVAGDALTFAALLIVYALLRNGAAEWPRLLSIAPAAGMTAVLMATSFTMWRAECTTGRTSAQWLLATLSGGLVFLALHLAEWRHLLAGGAGPGNLFGSTFFTITGLHMAHVGVGVVYLAVLAASAARGHLSEDSVRAGGVYWQFVDGVWLAVFGSLYLW